MSYSAYVPMNDLEKDSSWPYSLFSFFRATEEINCISYISFCPTYSVVASVPLGSISQMHISYISEYTAKLNICLLNKLKFQTLNA